MSNCEISRKGKMKLTTEIKKMREIARPMIKHQKWSLTVILPAEFLPCELIRFRIIRKDFDWSMRLK